MANAETQYVRLPQQALRPLGEAIQHHAHYLPREQALLESQRFDNPVDVNTVLWQMTIRAKFLEAVSAQVLLDKDTQAILTTAIAFLRKAGIWD